VRDVGLFLLVADDFTISKAIRRQIFVLFICARTLKSRRVFFLKQTKAVRILTWDLEERQLSRFRFYLCKRRAQ